ncbi:MAG: hypothetical protein GXY61_00160 [Lentisphaerae bacterium]|nr:hypothetical protein [Lentisphaerota bacterium]
MGEQLFPAAALLFSYGPKQRLIIILIVCFHTVHDLPVISRLKVLSDIKCYVRSIRSSITLKKLKNIGYAAINERKSPVKRVCLHGSARLSLMVKDTTARVFFSRNHLSARNLTAFPSAPRFPKKPFCRGRRKDLGKTRMDTNLFDPKAVKDANM